MWELDYTEIWALKNWCFWCVVLEKTLESPLHSKEIKSVSPKEIQCWIFIGRTDAKAEAAVLWLPDAKNWLLKKTPVLEKIEGRTEADDREWDWVHHWLNGEGFEQALEVSDGQGSLMCCSPWGYKQLETTEQLNWTCVGDRLPRSYLGRLVRSLGSPKRWNVAGILHIECSTFHIIIFQDLE